MSEPQRILLCRCSHADVIPPARSDAVAAALDASGVACDVVDDLCDLAARRDPRLGELAAADRLTVVACHPRAVRWLFARAGADLDPAGSELLDLRANDAEAILGRLGLAPCAEDSPALEAARREGQARRQASPDWLPWFPLIDYDRCKGCGQCLNFCLFGTFARSDGRIEVRRPEKCKTYCPACARVCPNTAIMFPKYKAGPINGDEVDASAETGETAQVDLSQLSRGDVYAALRRRSQARVHEPASSQEAGPRDCGQAIQRMLDIPDEVFENLDPSALRGRMPPGRRDANE